LLAAGDERKPRPASEAGLLYSLAGIDTTGQIGERLIVDASWEAPDRVHVAISSVLVTPAEARLAALALAMVAPSHMWLPTVEAHEENDYELRARKDSKPCEPWVAHPHAEVKIDDRDPNGSRSAVTRPRPSRQTIDMFHLASKDPWSEIWSDAHGRVAFRSRAWGRRIGSGEREAWDQGTALECDRRFLVGVLKKLDRNLVLLIKLSHYRERNRFGEGEEGGGQFTYSYMVAMVDLELKVSLPTPSYEEITAVADLGQHVRYEFRERLEALRRAPSDGLAQTPHGTSERS
jgi:hypothetical protein